MNKKFLTPLTAEVFAYVADVAADAAADVATDIFSKLQKFRNFYKYLIAWLN